MKKLEVMSANVPADNFDNDYDKLERVGRTKLRSGTGKFQSMGADKLVLKLPIKNLAHHLAAPSHKGERGLNHVLRYLQGTREDFWFLRIEKAIVPSIRADDFFGCVHQLGLGRNVCIHGHGRLRA